MNNKYQFKYNYIVCIQDWDLMQHCYRDLSSLDNVIVKSTFQNNLKRLKLPYRLHMNGRINRVVKLPFKFVWNKHLFPDCKFNNNNPICFIFSGYWVKLAIELNTIPYLRKKFIGCKIVWYLQDLVTKQYKFYDLDNADLIEFHSVRKLYDLVVSYDKGDCLRYNLNYYPTPFSCYHGNLWDMSFSDIYFCAKVKDRLPEVMRTYQLLVDQGLKVEFYLTGVEQKDQIEKEGITYGGNVSYEVIIQKVLHTKCILEIMQNGAEGFTMRTNEAIVFKKKLLTNNSKIKNSTFYDPANISIIENGRIETSFIQKIKNEGYTCEYENAQDLSPINFIIYVDNKFKNSY